MLFITIVFFFNQKILVYFIELIFQLSARKNDLRDRKQDIVEW